MLERQPSSSSDSSRETETDSKTSVDANSEQWGDHVATDKQDSQIQHDDPKTISEWEPTRKEHPNADVVDVLGLKSGRSSESITGRRLQTLVVVLHSATFVLSFTIFFTLCYFPVLWPGIVVYLIFMYFSDAGRSRSLAYRSHRLRSSPVWSIFASYFPARLHRTVELYPTRKYIFGYHPHGIICHGAFAAFGTEALGFSELFPASQTPW